MVVVPVFNPRALLIIAAFSRVWQDLATNLEKQRGMVEQLKAQLEEKVRLCCPAPATSLPHTVAAAFVDSPSLSFSISPALIDCNCFFFLQFTFSPYANNVDGFPCCFIATNRLPTLLRSQRPYIVSSTTPRRNIEVPSASIAGIECCDSAADHLYSLPVPQIRLVEESLNSSGASRSSLDAVPGISANLLPLLLQQWNTSFEEPRRSPLHEVSSHKAFVFPPDENTDDVASTSQPSPSRTPQMLLRQSRSTASPSTPISATGGREIALGKEEEEEIDDVVLDLDDYVELKELSQEEGTASDAESEEDEHGTAGHELHDTGSSDVYTDSSDSEGESWQEESYDVPQPSGLSNLLSTIMEVPEEASEDEVDECEDAGKVQSEAALSTTAASPWPSPPSPRKPLQLKLAQPLTIDTSATIAVEDPTPDILSSLVSPLPKGSVAAPPPADDSSNGALPPQTQQEQQVEFTVSGAASRASASSPTSPTATAPSPRHGRAPSPAAIPKPPIIRAPKPSTAAATSPGPPSPMSSPSLSPVSSASEPRTPTNAAQQGSAPSPRRRAVSPRVLDWGEEFAEESGQPLSLELPTQRLDPSFTSASSSTNSVNASLPAPQQQAALAHAASEESLGHDMVANESLSRALETSTADIAAAANDSSVGVLEPTTASGTGPAIASEQGELSKTIQASSCRDSLLEPHEVCSCIVCFSSHFPSQPLTSALLSQHSITTNSLQWSVSTASPRPSLTLSALKVPSPSASPPRRASANSHAKRVVLNPARYSHGGRTTAAAPLRSRDLRRSQPPPRTAKRLSFPGRGSLLSLSQAAVSRVSAGLGRLNTLCTHAASPPSLCPRLFTRARQQHLSHIRSAVAGIVQRFKLWGVALPLRR